MKKNISEYGFFRTAACTPEMRVADVRFNSGQIIKSVYQASEKGCSLIVFPELSLTGYTCGDLFYQNKLLKSVEEFLTEIASRTSDRNIALVVGAPVVLHGRLFNTAVVISKGIIRGIVPKTYLCNTNEYYEERWFSSEFDRTADHVSVMGQQIPFGADLLFRFDHLPDAVMGIEICEDLWTLVPPSFSMAAAGATVLCNLSASDEKLGKKEYRTQLVRSQSARCFAAYVYSASGPGESTTDLLYSGHSMICENGRILAENERFRFETQMAVADMDIQLINNERLRNNSYGGSVPERDYRMINLGTKSNPPGKLLRKVFPSPFIPETKRERNETAREIFSIQAGGLAKRIRHTGCDSLVVGISGGLDSTLALLVSKKSFEMLDLDPKGIIAVSMPGLGTSAQTKSNAEKLVEMIGVTSRTIPINDAVMQHFKDIEHDSKKLDIVYENTQARERTQILMDIANAENGLVVGTGDLSEIALGWSTYSGDHISMYSVNSGVPKTLVKLVIEWIADNRLSVEEKSILRAVLDTPISPELLPPDENGQIAQQTEKNLGPYEVHDFILFYAVRHLFAPAKIFFLARNAFGKKYSKSELKEWMKLFYTRFFSQQFKRSCMPDGVKIGSLALSPRGDWRMPSDAEAALWLDEIELL